jgi:hypothetical protein
VIGAGLLYSLAGRSTHWTERSVRTQREELAPERYLVREESSIWCIEIDRPSETFLDDVESKRDDDLRLEES